MMWNCSFGLAIFACVVLVDVLLIALCGRPVGRWLNLIDYACHVCNATARVHRQWLECAITVSVTSIKLHGAEPRRSFGITTTRAGARHLQDTIAVITSHTLLCIVVRWRALNSEWHVAATAVSHVLHEQRQASVRNRPCLTLEQLLQRLLWIPRSSHC